MGLKFRVPFVIIVALLALVTDRAAAQVSSVSSIPACRLDSSRNQLIQATLKRAIDAYAAIGNPLAIETIALNPPSPSTSAKTLDVYVIADAAKGATDPAGCATRQPGEVDPLDPVSVRGGCIVTAVERMEMRCSSSAVGLFARAGRPTERESVALLYVLAHELGHLHQKQLGEYAGRADRIDLAQPRQAKIETLRETCDPVSLKVEQDADAMSFDVMARLVGGPPYREAVLSERGSVYSNIDQLALSSNDWQKVNARRDFISQPAVHKSFEPSNFPTPPSEIDKNAKKFVCDVLKRNKGTIYYPSRSISHPPMDVRLQRIAEKLKPVADKLPANAGDPQFKAVAVLQGDLGPILTFIYRETGVYMTALQEKICTRVNGPKPDAGCP